MIKELSLSIGQLLGISTTIATLIAICICAVWSIIFNRIKEGQKAEFQKQIEEQKSEFAKEIENLKAKNEKLNYISKAQFDTEFKIYQELSEPVFDMFFDVMQLFPMGLDYVPEDEEDRKVFYEERYRKAMNNLMIFQRKLYIYAPFIPKQIYEMFDSFRVEARKQVNWYPDFIINPQREVIHELRDEKHKCWERTNELYKQYGEIIVKLREYLQTIKVTEGKE